MNVMVGVVISSVSKLDGLQSNREKQENQIGVLIV